MKKLCKLLRSLIPIGEGWSRGGRTAPQEEMIGVVVSPGEVFNPDWVCPPGATIAELLEEKGWDAEELASRMEVPVQAIEFLIDGQIPILLKTAENLSIHLGSTPEFWLRSDAAYWRGLKEGKTKI